MSFPQQNGYPQNPSQFAPHGFGPHGNFGFQQNQNNFQQNQPFPGRNNTHGFNQPHGGFPPRGNFQPQGFYQQQNQQPEPEPAHEHPLNFEGQLNEKCKVCLQNIGGNGGYKCKDCPIVLCLNCSQKIFFENKNKQVHQHDLLLTDRNSWTCNVCKTSYGENASFYCRQCDFDVCDKCYLNQSMPNPQNPQFPQSQPQPNQQPPYQPPFQPPYPQSQFQPQQSFLRPQFPQFPQNNNQQYPQQQPGYPQEQNVNQSQGGYQPQQGNNFIPQEQNYYQQGYQEEELQPESEHEHPLNYEEKLFEKCKLCLQNIGGNAGYKCKDCPIVLCLNCSDKIFYGYKNKQIHQHELFLNDRNNWNCQICKKHKTENASFYCSQCNFECCDECFMGPLQGFQLQNDPNIQQNYQEIQQGYIPNQEQENYESFHEHPLNYEEKLNDIYLNN